MNDRYCMSTTINGLFFRNRISGEKRNQVDQLLNLSHKFLNYVVFTTEIAQ